MEHHGGKGDKYRPVDVSTFRNNHDNIDWSSRRESKSTVVEEVEEIQKDKYQLKRFLLLDDIREPEHCQLHDEGANLIVYSGIARHKWEVVRSYEAFVQWVDAHGIPDVVSFDNDLSTECMMAYIDIVADDKEFDENSVDEKQGIHCAEYLVEKCKELGIDIPKYYVHSANMFARPIIRKIMENGKR